MMISKKTFLIWSNILNFLSLIILFVMYIIYQDADYIFGGYLLTAVAVLVSIFIRIWYINRNIFVGNLDSRYFKMSDEYQDYKFKNYYSFGLILVDITIAIIFSFIF